MPVISLKQLLGGKRNVDARRPRPARDKASREARPAEQQGKAKRAPTTGDRAPPPSNAAPTPAPEVHTRSKKKLSFQSARNINIHDDAIHDGHFVPDGSASSSTIVGGTDQRAALTRDDAVLPGPLCTALSDALHASGLLKCLGLAPPSPPSQQAETSDDGTDPTVVASEIAEIFRELALEQRSLGFGESLMAKGSACDEFYYVLSGQFRVAYGDSRAAITGAGTILGLVPFLLCARARRASASTAPGLHAADRRRGPTRSCPLPSLLPPIRRPSMTAAAGILILRGDGDGLQWPARDRDLRCVRSPASHPATRCAGGRCASGQCAYGQCACVRCAPQSDSLRGGRDCRSPKEDIPCEILPPQNRSISDGSAAGHR